MAPDELLSYRLLRLFLERELFNLEEMRPLENNPMRQAGFLNMGNYIRRDYAPLEERLRAAAETLKQVPDFLRTLDAALRDDLSRHVVDMSVESYAGMARFYRSDLASFASRTNDSALAAEFRHSLEAAASALDRFVENLKGRNRGDDNSFAIGSNLYSRMLATGEGLALPIDRIAAVGQANLEENLARIREVASSISPDRSVQDIVSEISLNHPSAQSLIPGHAGDAGRHQASVNRIRCHIPAFRRQVPGGGNAGLYALRIRGHG